MQWNSFLTDFSAVMVLTTTTGFMSEPSLLTLQWLTSQNHILAVELIAVYMWEHVIVAFKYNLCQGDIAKVVFETEGQ